MRSTWRAPNGTLIPFNPDRSVTNYLPVIFSPTDERPAVEQANDRYAHGGGWRKFSGFILGADKSLTYPGDPAYRPVAQSLLPLTLEILIQYPHGWVMIYRSPKDWEVSRLD